MRKTCDHALHMTTIRLRNVPPELHRKLKARAALAGLSLSDCLLDEIRRFAELPTPEEMRARLLGRSAISPDLSPTAMLRAERDSR